MAPPRGRGLDGAARPHALQYDPPSPLLLVAGYGLFIFHDSQLNQTTNLPLGATPLGLLLRDNLRLSGDVTVTGIERLPGQIQVSMVRTASPDEGSLTLVFADAPLALRQWSVVDAQRQETRVTAVQRPTGRHLRPESASPTSPGSARTETRGGGNP